MDPLLMLAELDATEDEREETSSPMMSRRCRARERRAKRLTLIQNVNTRLNRIPGIKSALT